MGSASATRSTEIGVPALTGGNLRVGWSVSQAKAAAWTMADPPASSATRRPRARMADSRPTWSAAVAAIGPQSRPGGKRAYAAWSQAGANPAGLTMRSFLASPAITARSSSSRTSFWASQFAVWLAARLALGMAATPG